MLYCFNEAASQTRRGLKDAKKLLYRTAGFPWSGSVLTSLRMRMRQDFDLFSFDIDKRGLSAIAEMDRGDSGAGSSGDPPRAD